MKRGNLLELREDKKFFLHIFIHHCLIMKFKRNSKSTLGYFKLGSVSEFVFVVL